MTLFEEFWERCQKKEFCLGHCSLCGHFHYYPQMVCPYCGSTEVQLQGSQGRGHVVSSTRVMVSFYPANQPHEVPYQIVQVQLHEGVRIMARMQDDTTEIRRGDVVFISFQPAKRGMVPVFRIQEVSL